MLVTDHLKKIIFFFFFQIIFNTRNHMIWNKKYNYPSSSRAIESGIRRYLIGEKKLPSVTSILDATKSEEDKAALANCGVKEIKNADQITKAASSRGSQMHSFLESYLLNRENLSLFDDAERI